MTYFHYLASAITSLFVIATLHQMLQGAWRRFPLLFLYLLLLLLLSVPLAIAFFRSGSQWTTMSATVYWILALLTQGIGILCVLAITRTATEKHAGAARIVRLMAAGTVLVLLGSLLAHWHYLSAFVYNRWLTHISRDLAVLSIVLNLLLWSRLLADRKRDPLVVLISAGLGVQFTGDAMGHALRYFPNELKDLGNLVFAGTTVLASFIWFRAFQRDAAKLPAKVGASL